MYGVSAVKAYAMLERRFALQKAFKAGNPLESAQAQMEDSVSISAQGAIARANKAMVEKLRGALEEKLQVSLGGDGSDLVGRTPEGTVEALTNHLKGLWGGYRDVQPDVETNEARDRFMGAVREGFERGYEEARGILEAMQLLRGEVLTGLEQTHELAHNAFDILSGQLH